MTSLFHLSPMHTFPSASLSSLSSLKEFDHSLKQVADFLFRNLYPINLRSSLTLCVSSAALPSPVLPHLIPSYSLCLSLNGRSAV